MHAQPAVPVYKCQHSVIAYSINCVEGIANVLNIGITSLQSAAVRRTGPNLIISALVDLLYAHSMNALGPKEACRDCEVVVPLPGC